MVQWAKGEYTWASFFRKLLSKLDFESRLFCVYGALLKVSRSRKRLANKRKHRVMHAHAGAIKIEHFLRTSLSKEKLWTVSYTGESLLSKATLRCEFFFSMAKLSGGCRVT